LREAMKKNPRQVFSFPMRSVVHNKSNDLTISSQIIDKTFQSKVKKAFLIRIDIINDRSKLDLRRIRGLYNLTRREAEIVGYVAQGQKYSDIAQNLHISELTVKTHIQNIFEKMNVNSRSAAIYKIMNEI
jgi:DNA-binding NarL/FixJ family response regulator